MPQILEARTSTTDRERYVYGISRLTVVATTDGGAESACTQDAHGSTLTGPGIASPSGYDAHGNGTSAAGAIHFGYRSELTLNGLVHLRNRDYDPTTGTFTTPDPLDGVDGAPTVGNPYHYADNDPLNKNDPSGLRPFGGYTYEPSCGRCGQTNPVVPFPTGCWDLPNATMRDYLTGRQCVPTDFDRYAPAVAQTAGGQRFYRMDGGCSALLTGGTGRSFDFRLPCQTHDYGYDLLRHEVFGERGTAVEAARKDVDDLFRDDLFTHCKTRASTIRSWCIHWAYTYAEVVELNSLYQGYEVP